MIGSRFFTASVYLTLAAIVTLFLIPLGLGWIELAMTLEALAVLSAVAGAFRVMADRVAYIGKPASPYLT
ncbi:hypothetical protein [Brevibacterium samyangense]|uniref:Uncharacterized protein n=1 Tax=Brevibacterium samyangense TaxID=366888 RepID=A0ABP5F106_9MICO